MATALLPLVPAIRKSAGEDPEDSFARQRAAIDAWANANGVALAAEQTDARVSGTRSWRERGVGRALELCERGLAGGIIVEDTTRLTREGLAAAAEIYEVMDARGFRLVAVADGIDTARGDQEMILGVQALVAKEKSKQSKRHAASNRRATVGRGVHYGNATGYARPSRAPGEQAKPLIVDEPNASAVRRAFEVRATGATIGAVCRVLDAEFPGGPNKTGAWAAPTVRQIVRNRVYLGEARCGEVVHPEAHPALVDRETFDLVQAMFAKRERSAPVGTKSLLAGMLFCGTCGRALDRTQLGGKHHRAGSWQYRCRRPSAAGKCPAPASAMVDQLDAHVLDLVRERFAQVGLEDVESTVDLGALRDELAALTAKRDAYVNPDTLDDLGGMDVVRPAVRKLNERRAEVERAIADATRGRPDADAIRVALDEFESLTVAEQRETLSHVVASVTVARSPRRGRGVPIADRVVVLGVDGKVLGE